MAMYTSFFCNVQRFVVDKLLDLRFYTLCMHVLVSGIQIDALHANMRINLT